MVSRLQKYHFFFVLQILESLLAVYSEKLSYRFDFELPVLSDIVIITNFTTICETKSR